MNDAMFYKGFKRHLNILKRKISKKQVLYNLKNYNCPFRLGKYNDALEDVYLALRKGEITGHFSSDENYLLYTDYFCSHLDKLIPKMIEIVKATKWRE